MAAGERGASQGTTEAAAAGEVGEVDGGGVGEAGEKGNNKDSGRSGEEILLMKRHQRYLM